MTIYKEWLSEDGKTIAKHTLREWIDILNIKPATIPMKNGKVLQSYTTTERKYAKYGYMDIYYNGYGILHADLEKYLNTVFYADNADIACLHLCNIK